MFIFKRRCAGRCRIRKRWGAPQVEDFLTHLAVNRNLAASSQNRALHALVFLYREVLKIGMEGIQATPVKR